MKNLIDIIQEKLKVGSNSKVNKNNDIIIYNIDELKNEIQKRIKNKNTDFTDIDVSNLTDLSNIFLKTDITEIDITGWDVSKCKNMKSMFYECKYLKKIIGLDTWNVSNCENFSFMFADCINLINIGDISKWNPQNANCKHMFSYTEKLKTIGDIYNWKLKEANWDVFELSSINPQPQKRP